MRWYRSLALWQAIYTMPKDTLNFDQPAYLFLIFFNLKIFPFLEWDFFFFPSQPHLSCLLLIFITILWEHFFMPSLNKHMEHLLCARQPPRFGAHTGNSATLQLIWTCLSWKMTWGWWNHRGKNFTTPSGEGSTIPGAGCSWTKLWAVIGDYLGGKCWDILCINKRPRTLWWLKWSMILGWGCYRVHRNKQVINQNQVTKDLKGQNKIF